MGKYVTKKKDMYFKDIESMQPIANIINEAALALKDKSHTISNSSISEILSGALGAGVGGGASFAALYGLGLTGLSAAGITSGLATAGAIVGGGMVAGVFVLAAPVAALSAAGVGIASKLKANKLKSEKERVFAEAVAKQNAIIKALQNEKMADKNRIDCLNGINILLERAIKDLKHDLGVA